VVVEDRLAALISELCKQLTDAGAGDAVVGAQQALDLLLEGVELGGRFAAKARRMVRGASRCGGGSPESRRRR
jgi:hypothetical protein